MDLAPYTVMRLSDADRALGRLAGTGRLLPNPHLLIQPYIAREALASSRIEGTQASLSDVFDAQARNKPEGPILKVTNYIRALKRGLDGLNSLSVSRRLFCEVHEVLLSGVRGRELLPGEVRRSQNWIGSPDNRPETAVFVPPDVNDMDRAFDDLERFVHEETSTSSSTAASTTTGSRRSGSEVSYASGSCSSSPASPSLPTTPSAAPSDWSTFERATASA